MTPLDILLPLLGGVTVIVVVYLIYLGRRLK